jgi:hypothetical protein
MSVIEIFLQLTGWIAIAVYANDHAADRVK